MIRRLLRGGTGAGGAAAPSGTASGTAAAGLATPEGPLLAVEGITVHHGQLEALHRVELEVQPGDTYAIIGANGAGKSTLLRTVAGLHRPTEGRVLLDGVDLTHQPPERRLAAGIALVPEGRRLFPSLTVEENLLVGMHRRRPGPFDLDRVYGLFEWLPGRRRQRASQLSGGEQQAVAIGRALLANPRVLLLDELSLGLAPIVVTRIYEVLPTLVQEGLTVLLVEQDVAQARRVATRVQCLLEGHTSLVGAPDELTGEEIERAYFGVGSAAAVVGGGAGAAPMEGVPAEGAAGSATETVGSETEGSRRWSG